MKVIYAIICLALAGCCTKPTPAPIQTEPVQVGIDNVNGHDMPIFRRPDGTYYIQWGAYKLDYYKEKST